jgi:hypothetical protein
MRDLFMRSHPEEPSVWKDPRNCLTLPFWRATIPDRPSIVFMTRDPPAVAASLQRRDHFTTTFGLALWERYTRLALAGMSGLPVFVSTYESLTADPLQWCEIVSEFLDSSGNTSAMPPDPIGIQAVARRRDATPHSAVSSDSTGLSDEQRALCSSLADVDSPSMSFNTMTSLPPETPATASLFEDLRTAYELAPGSTRVHPPAGLFTSSTGIALFKGHAGRHSVKKNVRSRISVVMLGDTASAFTESENLFPRLPSSAEILSITAVSRKAEQSDSSRVRAVNVQDGLTTGGRLNLGAEIASGDLLIFCRAGIVPQFPWIPELRKGLACVEAGAVGPALIPDCAPQYRLFGIQAGQDLVDLRWITAAPNVDPFPVMSLSEWTLATPRRVFEAVGGFDDHMHTLGVVAADFCIRVWRSGYRCLAVPRAKVACPIPEAHEVDGARTTYQPNDAITLGDQIRLTLLHLTGAGFNSTLGQLASRRGFPTALIEAIAGEVGQRRMELDATAWYDTTWIMRHLRLAGSKYRD